MMIRLACAAGVLLCATGAMAREAIPAGAGYVAMGSSYAAGAGIQPPAETPVNRCGRSAENYPSQLARKRGLTLTDVSCGGATTANILRPWNELPAQLDALKPDTRLVTITIGGNDVGYMMNLYAASCQQLTPTKKCPTAKWPTDADWAGVRSNMDAIIAEVRQRSPRARLIFVDYVQVLPAGAPCAATPLSPEAAERGRALAARLATITAEAARAGRAEVLKASALSRGHDACAADPWMNGLPAPGATPYHPNKTGTTAVAEALNHMLGR